MGVFYNPPPNIQIPFSQPLGGGFTPPSRKSAPGRDIAAEKWDKDQKDEKLFDEIITNNVNEDTGDIDWQSTSKEMRLKGLSKEADLAEEQYVKTSQARLESQQKTEMEDLNDTAQAYQLIASGKQHLRKIGLTHLQKNDPGLVDVQQADRDGNFFNEVRDDGTVNKVSTEKIWKSLVTAKDLLLLKQADDQFRFKLTEESKILSVDKLKSLAWQKYNRIEAKIQSGTELNPNDPVDNLTKSELELVASVKGSNKYIHTAATAMMADPTFRVRMLRDSKGAIEELSRGARLLEQADKTGETPTKPLGTKEPDNTREAYIDKIYEHNKGKPGMTRETVERLLIEQKKIKAR